MPVKYLVDDQGYKLKIRDVDGRYTFPWQSTNDDDFRSIRSWNAKDDDIIICAYTKSGTHWLFEVANMLLSQEAKRVKEPKQISMLDAITQEHFDNLQSPRVLNCHSLFQDLPKDFVRRKCKIVHIVRNPKDVMVSFFHHHRSLAGYEFTGPWNDYIGRFLKGNVDYNSWFDYTLAWEKTMADNPDYPIHLMHYEDLKENPIAETTRLATFLGVSKEVGFIGDVVELCSFDSMKADKYVPKEMVLTDHGTGIYRKGIVGDWKNMFTISQNDMFDKYYESRMKDSKLKFRYSL